MSTPEKLFGSAANFLGVIDAITPIALNHKYTFLSDVWFSNWLETETPTTEQLNFILALELIDKAHLAALTALMRTKRWADATCLMYDSGNFVGWAASVRGLLESSGDTVDGLLHIPLSLAKYHRLIKRCLAGKEKQPVGYPELEATLDHFVHARWMRTKRNEENVLKAKENAAYVGVLEAASPGILKLYHKLCAICHPSNESMEYFYNPVLGPDEGFGLSQTNDAKAIAAICIAYPDALSDALMMSCNVTLYILRVLHKFEHHPRLAALKKIDWQAIKMGAEIEPHLTN